MDRIRFMHLPRSKRLRRFIPFAPFLAIAVFALSVHLYVANVNRQYAAQIEAMRWIASIRGSVETNYGREQNRYRFTNKEPPPPGPWWIRALTHNEMVCDRIYLVVLRNRAVTTDDIDQLRSLAELTQLHI